MKSSRPKIVLWTAILLSVAGAGIIALQIELSRPGGVDISSYLQGAFFLASGLLLLFRPDWKPAFYLASAALLIFSLRAFLATYTLWRVTGQLGQVPFSLLLATLIFLLTKRFYCSLPVRLFFGIKKSRTSFALG